MTDLRSASAPPTEHRSRLSFFAAPILMLAISISIFFVPLLSGTNDVPGDMGDNRFNIYVLEHVYRWITGLDHSLLSLPIFFPYPYTFGFSDVHAGSAAFYVAFRFVGWNEYDAFKAWLVIGYVLTFVASYVVLVRLSISPFLAALGAFAFAFSLPAIVQIGHGQLTYRLGVPLSIYSALRYAQSKRPVHLLATVGWTSLQILVNIYLGFFTLLLSAIVFGVALAIEHPFSRGWFRTISQQLRPPLGRRESYGVALCVVIVVVFGAALAMLGFYGFVSWLYGFGRSWADVLPMVPRPWSYLLVDGLPYWAQISAAMPSISMRGEQQLFLGIPTTALFIAGAGYVAIRHREASASLRLFVYSSLVLLLVMTKIGPVVLYWFVAQLPGFDALRAVSRFQLVGAFPIIVAGLLFIQQVRFLEKWRAVVIGLIGMWAVGDVYLMQKLTFSSQESRSRVDAVVAQVRAKPIHDDFVLAYTGDPVAPPYINQIDAMFAAAQLDVPTLNGYSGNFVPGYEYAPSCGGFLRQLSVYDGWAGAHGQSRLDIVWRTPLLVSTENCVITHEMVRGNSYTEGAAPDVAEAKSIRLLDANVRQDNGHLLVDVTLFNGTSETIHSISPNPLRLSWRIASPETPLGGWDERVDVGGDLAAGARRTITFSIEGGNKAGDHLEVSFVFEGKFWGHDVGVAPIELSLPQ